MKIFFLFFDSLKTFFLRRRAARLARLGNRAVESLTHRLQDSEREAERLTAELAITRRSLEMYVAINEREYERVLAETAWWVTQQETLKGPQPPRQ